MTMVELIAFDADDTLWHNEGHYTNAKERFIQILSKYHPPALIEDRLDAIEIGNIGSYGYGIKSFVLSMIEAAVEISDGLIRGSEIQDILALGRDMLHADVHVLDKAEKILSELAVDFPLMLITKGDPIEQRRKIIHSGLEKYFRYIEIVGEKTPDTYRVLFEKYNLQPSQVLMIGNSLRSDILPVIQIGGRAVYVPYENTWSHENNVGDGLKNYTYFEIEKLEDLPHLVSNLDIKHS